MIYEYKCQSCNKVFDGTATIETRNVIKKCPICLELKGIRIISKPMFDSGGTNAQKLARLDSDNKYKVNL